MKRGREEVMSWRDMEIWKGMLPSFNGSFKRTNLILRATNSVIYSLWLHTSKPSLGKTSRGHSTWTPSKGGLQLCHAKKKPYLKQGNQSLPLCMTQLSPAFVLLTLCPQTDFWNGFQVKTQENNCVLWGSLILYVRFCFIRWTSQKGDDKHSRNRRNFSTRWQLENEVISKAVKHSSMVWTAIISPCLISPGCRQTQ